MIGWSRRWINILGHPVHSNEGVALVCCGEEQGELKVEVLNLGVYLCSNPQQ